MSHKVKVHKWLDGALQTVEHLFESAEAAMGFLDTDEGKYAHGIKVYNENGEMIHALNPDIETNLVAEAGYA
jgi:hypothetical protein